MVGRTAVAVQSVSIDHHTRLHRQQLRHLPLSYLQSLVVERWAPEMHAVATRKEMHRQQRLRLATATHEGR